MKVFKIVSKDVVKTIELIFACNFIFSIFFTKESLAAPNSSKFSKVFTSWYYHNITMMVNTIGTVWDFYTYSKMFRTI